MSKNPQFYDTQDTTLILNNDRDKNIDVIRTYLSNLEDKKLSLGPYNRISNFYKNSNFGTINTYLSKEIESITNDDEVKKSLESLKNQANNLLVFFINRDIKSGRKRTRRRRKSKKARKARKSKKARKSRR
tara:strand:- start:171 stop:563 length:393 start_codon:yes stop_codon:yes gene_type:complete